MAVEIWAKPQDVKDYTSSPAVKERTDPQLTIDIARAQAYIVGYTNNDFKAYTELPGAIHTATVILADHYAQSAAAAAGGSPAVIQSETFDDYSYTARDGIYSLVDFLNLGALLNPFILEDGPTGFDMSLRRL